MYLSLSIEHEVLNLKSTWTRSCYHQETYKYRIVEFKRISLIGFRSCPSLSRYQSVSKQTTRLIHIESRKPPTAELFDVDSGRISIVTVNTKEYHSDVLAVITRIMRRTLVTACELDDVQQLLERTATFSISTISE
ncbi:hypothetical protein Tco_1182244 [Tanacetum coccineum]